MDQLHVYQPTYPYQTIQAHATAIVKLPVTAPRLRGHLNPHRPHSVNNVIVGNLGEQEVVLCGCDDGDVLAFYTDALARAVERREGFDETEEAKKVADEVQPFFHVNVRLSAWGLSIHEKARMIAISSNMHEITVFAFALSTEQPLDRQE